MIPVQSGETFETVAEGFATGLVGTVGVRLLDNIGNTVIARTTAGIIEQEPGSGTYSTTLTAPVPIGQYSVMWDDASGTPQGFASDDVFVYAGAVPPILPVPPVVGQGPQYGPCQNWTTVEDVAACCPADVGTYDTLYEDAITVASQMLFMLSGRLNAGICEKTVRPCSTAQWCGVQVLSRGYVVGWNGAWGWGWWGDQGWSRACGCQPTSRILLSGYPVTSITQVLINGEVVDPATYRLDEWRFLTRVRDPAEPDVELHWPTCQNMDVGDSEEGAFAVTYEYGADPPALGQEAAKQLACQIYLACVGSDQCELPQGTTRITRQGLQIERTFFGRDPKTNAWRTGLTLVDSFLNMVNPNGLLRRPSVYAPGRRYARPVGIQQTS